MFSLRDVTRQMPNTEGPRIIVILSNKGGIGKTKTANDLLHGLAAHGFKGMGLELEGSPRLWQINTPGYDGLPEPATSQTTYGLLEHPERGVHDGLYTIKTNDLIAAIPHLHTDARAKLIADRHWGNAQPFFMLPGHRDMSILVDHLGDVRRARGENVDLRLARAFQVIDITQFDFIVIDTPPTSNLFQTNGLKSQYLRGRGVSVIIPVDFDPGASEKDFILSEAKVQTAITECAEDNLPVPEILGVVYNMFSDETADEIDGPMYQRYTQWHAHPRTGAQTPPLIDYPQLGFLKRDSDVKRAMARSQSCLTFTPTKPSGEAAYALVCAVERATGMDRYVR